MKSFQIFFWMYLLFIGLGISACCSGIEDLPPPATIDFAIYDSTGEDNLFDEDGPFSIDSIQIFEDDGFTPVDFTPVSIDGGFYMLRFEGDRDVGIAQNTYQLHIPNGDIDILVGTFKFFEGDRCSSSFWTFDGLTYNGVSFSERNDQGYIKVLRE